MFGDRVFVDAGGLMSYGPNYPAMSGAGFMWTESSRHTAGRLPVEQPTSLSW